MKSLLVGLCVAAIAAGSAPSWANLSPYADRAAAGVERAFELFEKPSSPPITELDVSRLSLIASLTDHHCDPERDDSLLGHPYYSWPALGAGDGTECSSGVEWVFPTSTEDSGTVIVNGVIRSAPGAGEGDELPYGINVQSLIRSGNGALELLGLDSTGPYSPAVTERVVTLRLAPSESRGSKAAIPGSGTLALIGIGLLVLGLAAWRFRRSARPA